jgi:uncharacterized membrane protein YuzA (DUF378 family)
MKNCSPILLTVLLLALDGIGYGQSASHPTFREVERQVRWLERQNFPAHDYRWNNPPVNNALQNALRINKQANRQLIGGYSLVGVGGGAVVVGCLGMFTLAAIAPIVGQDAADEATRYGVIAGVGLGALVSGIIVSKRGRKKRRRAKESVQSAIHLLHKQP